MNLLSIGTDTETNEGPPCTFQFYSGPEDLNALRIKTVREENAAESALDTLADLLGARDQAILWAFNYHFDLISLFYDLRFKFMPERFDFNAFGWNFRGVRVQRGAVFATLRQDGTRRKVYLRDTARFYDGNLEAVGKLFCSNLPKLPKPEGLGRRILDPSDPTDRAYMIRDAEIPYWIGKGILRWFDRFDVPLCTSSADFAGKVFRRKFIPSCGLHYPSAAGLGASYLAYHGGKNLYPEAKPAHFERVYSLDIRSAYPYAMTKLPDFSDPKRYHWGTYAELCGTNPTRETWGVFKVSGRAATCRWPSVYGPKMKVISGEFKDLWIAGPEIYEALASGELEIDTAWGFVYEDDPSAPHPFREFAEYFYDLRINAATDAEKETYKKILNSLSGKLAEVRKDPEDLTEVTDEGPVFKVRTGKPGPVFHPMAAALITSYTRSTIHKYEHKYKAIHTSTDGIFTQTEPDAADLVERLGGLKVEAFGTLDVLRNKLYLLRDAEGRILKEARHGFRGNVAALVDCIDNGKLEYDYVRCNSLKESFKRGFVVNRFDTYHAKIKLKKG